TGYQYWGAGNYKQTEVTIAGATAYWPDYRWQPGTAVYHYDVNGHLRQVEDEQGGRVVDFVNNAQGQILRREESRYDSSFTISSYGTLQYTEKANLFYLNGIVIGEVNTSGPSRQDYRSEER